MKEEERNSGKHKEISGEYRQGFFLILMGREVGRGGGEGERERQREGYREGGRETEQEHTAWRRGQEGSVTELKASDYKTESDS